MVNFANNLLVYRNHHPVNAPVPQAPALTSIATRIDEPAFDVQDEATVLADAFVQRLQSAQFSLDTGSFYPGATFH